MDEKKVNYMRCSCRGCGAIGNFEVIIFKDRLKPAEPVSFTPLLYHVCNDANIGVCDIEKIYIDKPVSEIHHTSSKVYFRFEDALAAARELRGE